jgi:transcriptional regulator with AAA-type ATPase domain
MSEPAPDGAPDSTTPGASSDPRSGRRLAQDFRWQGLFQRTAEPLFLLDRRRRLLFVNRAWEELTGVPAAEAHVLVCRRQRPASLDDSPEEILAHALTPPPEVLQGAVGRVRRLLPGLAGGAVGPALAAPTRWWEVEFFPLRQEDRTGGFIILGRIRPVSAEAAAALAPLPERLMNLRERLVRRHGLELWASPLPALRRLVEQARLASRVTAPVLLVGEPGAGKQTLARAIHYQGPRREAAFAALDCTRLPPAAVAAVLFEGGTGSPPARRGALGAVYLQEPARLPRDLQLRLCEWLAAAGPESPRVLAGCAAPPADEVRAGRLLEELACALATLVIEVPPLRQRREDLPGLVEQLLQRANSDSEVRVTGLAPDAWEVVRAYPWPGNLRELYAALRTAQGRAYGERIAAADLPAPVRRAVLLEQTPGRPAERKLPLDQLLEQAERRLIELALRRARGHKTRAAEILSIWRQRLTRRMEALEIADTEEEDRG